MITPRRFELCKEIWRLVGTEQFLWSFIKDHVSEPIGEFKKLQDTVFTDCGWCHRASTSTHLWRFSDDVILTMTSRVGPADLAAEKTSRDYIDKMRLERLERARRKRHES